MCGYARRHITNKDLREFVKSIEMLDVFRGDRDETLIEHFRPAFGGAAHNQIRDLIIQEDGQLKAVNATWWHNCVEHNGQLIVNNKVTSFNARNLHIKEWRESIRKRRGIVLATAIGEGKMVGEVKEKQPDGTYKIIEKGKKTSFFVEGEKPLLLGALYRSFPSSLYSTAIITRDEHLRFSTYHDKAFPLMLPPDPQFLKLWLSDEPETHPAIAHLLENPRIFTGLNITPVKTFKDRVPLGDTVHLTPDELSLK